MSCIRFSKKKFLLSFNMKLANGGHTGVIPSITWPCIWGRGLNCTKKTSPDYQPSNATTLSSIYWLLLYLVVNMHAVIGQLSGPYSPVQPAKI